MNFLSGEELKKHIERGLIEEGDPDALIEDIKYPLTYRGKYGKPDPYREEVDSWKDTTVVASEVEIPPKEHKTLFTQERIETSYLADESPVRIVGFVIPRHSLIREGVIPGHQGIIDTAWQGNEPLRIKLVNIDSTKKIRIKEGQRIGYVYFNYITSSSGLSDEQISEGQERNMNPDFEVLEATSKSENQINELEEKLSRVEDRLCELEEKHRKLNKAVEE